MSLGLRLPVMDSSERKLVTGLDSLKRDVVSYGTGTYKYRSSACIIPCISCPE